MEIPVLDPIFFDAEGVTVELRDVRRPEMVAAAMTNVVLAQMLDIWTGEFPVSPPAGFAAGLFVNGILVGSGIFHEVEVVNPDPLTVAGRVLLATPDYPQIATTLMANIDGYIATYQGQEIIFNLKP